MSTVNLPSGLADKFVFLERLDSQDTIAPTDVQYLQQFNLDLVVEFLDGTSNPLSCLKKLENAEVSRLKQALVYDLSQDGNMVERLKQHKLFLTPEEQTLYLQRVTVLAKERLSQEASLQKQISALNNHSIRVLTKNNHSISELIQDTSGKEQFHSTQFSGTLRPDISYIKLAEQTYFQFIEAMQKKLHPEPDDRTFLINHCKLDQGARSLIENTDPEDLAKHDFIEIVAKEIEPTHRSGYELFNFKMYPIICDPKMYQDEIERLYTRAKEFLVATECYQRETQTRQGILASSEMETGSSAFSTKSELEKTIQETYARTDFSLPIGMRTQLTFKKVRGDSYHQNLRSWMIRQTECIIEQKKIQSQLQQGLLALENLIQQRSCHATSLEAPMDTGPNNTKSKKSRPRSKMRARTTQQNQTLSKRPKWR
jgi:hypothetical protein